MFITTGEEPSTSTMGSGLPTPVQREGCASTKGGSDPRPGGHHATVQFNGTESAKRTGTASVAAMSHFRVRPAVLRAMTAMRMPAARRDQVGKPLSAYHFRNPGNAIFSMKKVNPSTTITSINV